MRLTDADFVKLRDFMYENFGVNLAKKRTLIEGRLQSTIRQRGFKSFSDFIENLIDDQSGGEVSLLVSRLTTNFTYFMREKQHFDFLHDTILPEVVPQINDNNLALWSAGCSSGEEPYSIAMVMDDYFADNQKGSLDTRILASDISDRVLGTAKAGIYGKDRMSKLPSGWETRYFTQIGHEKFRVKPEIKEEVIYRNFNLMEPVFKFRRDFHVVFCRNVMIYFDAPTREALAKRFYSVMRPGGYLIIGMSESLINVDTKFEYIKPSIYRKPFV